MITDKLANNNKKNVNEDSWRDEGYRPKRKRRFKSSGGKRVGGFGGKRSSHSRKRSY